MFEHNFVEKKKLTKKNIDGKRYYILPDGVTQLRSVTTIIADSTDKSGIINWRKKVGNVEANRVSAIATSRGTSVHKMAENYLLNESYVTEKTMPSNAESFEPIRRHLSEHVNNIRGIELPLYSTYLKAAGTCDLIAEYDKETSIIDHKTSKRLKKEDWIEDYMIQSTAYALMFRGMYDIPIEQFIVLITVDGQKDVQVFKRNIRPYITRVKEIFLR